MLIDGQLEKADAQNERCKNSELTYRSSDDQTPKRRQQVGLQRQSYHTLKVGRPQDGDTLLLHVIQELCTLFLKAGHGARSVGHDADFGPVRMPVVQDVSAGEIDAVRERLTADHKL